jgi:hypothetical protein
VQDTEIYQQARARARRTLTFRLDRQERRILSQVHGRVPTSGELARLAAIRREREGRRAGHRRAFPMLSLWNT